jgi:hypothetical protein
MHFIAVAIEWKVSYWTCETVTNQPGHSGIIDPGMQFHTGRVVVVQFIPFYAFTL